MFYTINDRPLTDLIWQALAFVGGVDPAVPAPAFSETATGASVLVTRQRLAGRTLTLSVELRPPTMLDRTAAVDAITRRLAGPLEIVRDDAPGRVWTGMLQQVTASVPAGNLVNPLTVLDITITVPDPRRWDRETLVAALGTTPVSCPTGTGVSGPTLVLFGAATPVVDPVVILRAPSGAELARLELVGSLADGHWLEIDTEREWLYRVAGGPRTVALEWLAGGAFPLLDGADAAGPAGPYPTLTLTAASGTPTGVATWRRSWM